MRVQRDSVIFAYQMNDIFSSGGNRYLRDFGPNGFHMLFPGGGANPTPQLDGSLYFDGGDYLYYDGDLARYYAQMPTTPYTFLWRGSVDVAATLGIVYSSRITVGGVNYGVELNIRSGTTPYIFCYNLIGDASFPYARTVSDDYGRGRRRVCLLTVETSPRSIVSGVYVSTLWGGGSYAPTKYHSTALPCIGRTSVGGTFLTGTLTYLCLLRGAISTADMAELSSMMLNATSGSAPWPFCTR